MGFKASAALIEGDDLEIGPERDLALIGRQRAGEEIDQRRLSRAVGAYETDAVAAGNLYGEIINNFSSTEGFGDMLGDDGALA